MWEQEVAVEYLNAHALPGSVGRCAEFVRKAIAAGGIQLTRHNDAKDYGNSLVAAGFTALGESTAQAGDVAVIQPIPGHPHGHMAMYNGAMWVSDFKQLHGYYPGPGYRSIRPPVVIYRQDH